MRSSPRFFQPCLPGSETFRETGTSGLKSIKIHRNMKSTISNSLLPFIIVFCTLMGVVTGCASRPTPSINSHPGPDARSGPVTTLPYRVDGRVYYPLSDSSGFDQEGIASWYGRDFHGKLTSNGEVYNMNSLTAAHKTLPFNSLVQVTHRESGKSVIVRINDRGPFVGERVIDLSYQAAQELGMAEQGTAPVKLRVLPENSVAPRRKAAGRPDRVGNFSVQVGVFANPDNARKISRRFRHSRIQPVKKNHQRYSKVLVGKYSNYRKALGDMDRIRLRGYEKAFIVLNP